MTQIDVTAADGHVFSMYRADPDGPRRGAVVVLQEIFGVNGHIRSVCDRLAALGYVAAAPALFDRVSRGYETGYAPEDVQSGLALMKDFDLDAALRDVAAAVNALQDEGPVSVMGFCLGGSLAYRIATQDARVASAACYYGGLIERFSDAAPLCPVRLFYGAEDPTISAENVATVRRKQPDLPVHVFPAGHGFSCDSRPAFDPDAAIIAWTISMRMIDEVSIQSATDVAAATETDT
ncbi:dienelactone hydrolase family protein [Mesobacterium pallidum]|uniref:dienelactone hydrolase family protein n=1 Tax=Mesobacterium pallidum TaxID=2872037 RepID=UPI001EE33454|nr:dienelactone hydrolase family protein [Mesobacterium pallidum]